MGISCIQAGHGSTWLLLHKQGLKHIQKALLWGHLFICRNGFYWARGLYLQFGQFCSRNGLRESLGRPRSPHGALLSTLGRTVVSVSWSTCNSGPWVFSRAAQNLYLKRNSQNWSNTSQWRQLEFDKALRTSTHWTKPVPCLTCTEAGWGVPGHHREWMAKCPTSVHWQILAVTILTTEQS